jgi:hypothetical protein
MNRANILWMVALLFHFSGAASWAGDRQWAVSLYGGRMTHAEWEEVLGGDVGFQDAYLAALAVEITLKKYFDEALSVALEAQVAKYFGDQDPFEFNLPLLSLRWQRFPWQAYLATTLAFGIGPSYATEVPSVEADIDGESERWMVYWFGELTFGPPQGKWALLVRLHHRSEAFGLVAENGGSNTLAAGLRFCF